MISTFRAGWRLAAYVLLTFGAMLVQVAALTFHASFAKTFPVWYHRQVCRLMGLAIERKGRPRRKGPVLFVSNHVSYLDIEVLGSLIKGSFVAKAEVRTWPFFSWLARLQRTVFVDRRRHKTSDARDDIRKRLEEGDNLILFPEGTTSDGNRILPFKSALFSAAEVRPGGEALTVQPVSIAYARLDGLPLGRWLRPMLAWYGDMSMASHVPRVFGLGKVGVVVEFHPAVTIDQLGGRKALAAYCHAAIERGVAGALTGRTQSPLRSIESFAAGTSARAPLAGSGPV